MDRENGTHIKWCWIHANSGMADATLTASVSPLCVDFAFPASFSDHWHRVVKKHVVKADVVQHLSP